jgi:hypothetical protein
MDMKNLLLSLLSGDTDAMMSLSCVSHEELLESVKGVELVIRPESVAEVLRKLSSHSIDGKTAQRWASFIRRGFFEKQYLGRAVRPLSIDYETAHEDAIAEVISRLDEIGDVVDGDVPGEPEIELLLYSLGFHS